jgi:glycine betaine/proline transport system permease protein
MEATTSMGSSRGQLLRKVQLPMAKRTIIVGVNQTIMAALSMATIAALIDSPGLGQPVVQALQSLDVGNAFVSGLAIVIMAIMLDRTTTAASVRTEEAIRSGRTDPKMRRVVLATGAVVAVVLVYISHMKEWAAAFPESPDLGGPIAKRTQIWSDWISLHGYTVTHKIADAVSYGLLNPLQTLLADSPWYLISAVLLAISAILGGWRSAATTAVCLALLIGTGLWNDAMVTLTMTLVATLLVMALALVFGVWMARSAMADRMLRPLLDAGQTIPPFVYLVPALALFGATRLTAIVAAIVYAAPPAIKLVADGIRGVSPTAVEAAVAAGSSRWQVITKVQLPMARSALVLAANQGLLYVLSMVVIGGLVGAGALGFLVVSGFSQPVDYGKGLAAGIAIVLLGIMLDRITQRAAARSSSNLYRRSIAGS